MANPFWNNWVINAKPDTSAPFIDAMGNRTTIRATLSSYIAVFDNGAGYLGGKSIFPDTVNRKGAYNSGIVTVTLTGLDDSSTYMLSFYGSRNRTDGQATIFSIAGQPADTLLTDTNTSRMATFSGLASTGGKIVIAMQNKATYDYLNAFQLIGRLKHPKVKARIWIDSTAIHYPRSFVKVTADSSTGAVSTQWLVISGPAGAIFSPFGDTMYVAGLVPGFYGIQLTVQDSLGNLDSTVASVLVNGAPVCPVCPPPVVCPPCPPLPAPRSVTGLNLDLFSGKATLTYDDGNTQVINIP